MKKMISLFALFLVVVSFAGAQSSQCIFTGTVLVQTGGSHPLCSIHPVGVELLDNEGNVLRPAFFDTVNQTYGVSAFSGDGLNDSDEVQFRILFDCDTVLARTGGDEAIFIGTESPAPPFPRSINLWNNQAPTITPVAGDTVYEDVYYQRQLSVTDADYDVPSLALISGPSWLSYNDTTRYLTGTPGAADLGTSTIVVVADDGYDNGKDTLSFELTVLHTNHAPSTFHLLTPEYIDTVIYSPSDTVHFSWQRSHDVDAGDIVGYELVIVSLALDTLRYTTLDSTYALNMLELTPAMYYAWSVFVTDGLETVASADTFFFLTTPYEDVNELTGIPTEFSLKQNYPNPFNPTTVIRYELPVEGHVTLKIYNLLGVELRTLIDETQTAGFKDVLFNGDNLPSGVYMYRLVVKTTKQENNFSAVKKFILMR